MSSVPRDPRKDLLLGTWINRDIPPREFLLGKVLSRTCRWLLFGPTGHGKTLFGMGMGGAMSAGLPFLNWDAGPRARVMYLDGELPAQTFKERMILLAQAYGA